MLSRKTSMILVIILPPILVMMSWGFGFTSDQYKQRDDVINTALALVLIFVGALWLGAIDGLLSSRKLAAPSLRLVMHEDAYLRFEDGTTVTENEWHELPWDGASFITYEHGRHIDCGPKVYRAYFRMKGVPEQYTGEYEITGFKPGTTYVLSPQGIQKMEPEG